MPYFASVISDAVAHPRFGQRGDEGLGLRSIKGNKGSEGKGGGGGKGAGGGGQDTQAVVMWVCAYCNTKSFMHRGSCFGCGREKPSRVELAEEYWRNTALGRATRTEGGEVGTKGRGKDVASNRGGGGKGEGRRAEAGPREGPAERTWVGLEPGQRWADVGGGEDEAAMESGARINGGRQAEGRRSYKEAAENAIAGKSTGKGGGGIASTGQSRERKIDEPKASGKTNERKIEGPKANGKGNRGGNSKGAGAPPGEGAGDRRQGKGLHEEVEEEGEWGQKRGDQEDEQESAPVQLPPLPRKWLVGRLAELEKCVDRLSADDPRAQIAEQRLHRTRGEVKLAGGRTSKRLFFSLAGGVDRLGRAEKVLEEAEGKVERVRSELEEAQRERDIAWELLERERTVHVYRGFEAAAEASQVIGGFGNIMQSMQKMGEMLAKSGEGEQEWMEVASFLNRFGEQKAYAASEDSDVRDLWSESNATREEEEAGGRTGSDEQAQLDEEAEVIRRAFAPSRGEEALEKEREGLARMREKAGQAMLAIQNTNLATGGGLLHGIEKGTGVQATGQTEEQKQAGDLVRLAIMDAADRAVPSSGESGGEGSTSAMEPRTKRRGREVQVAGGKTSDDITMATEKQKQATKEAEGEDL